MRRVAGLLLTITALAGIMLIIGCGGENPANEIGEKKSASFMSCSYVGQVKGTFVFRSIFPRRTSNGGVMDFCLADKARKNMFDDYIVTLEECGGTPPYALSDNYKWKVTCMGTGSVAPVSICNKYYSSWCVGTTSNYYGLNVLSKPWATEMLVDLQYQNARLYYAYWSPNSIVHYGECPDCGPYDFWQTYYILTRDYVLSPPYTPNEEIFYITQVN